MSRIVMLFLVGCLLCPLHAQARPSSTPCERLEQQRERVFQQLRKGYNVARGNQLRARWRELSQRIARECR